VIDVALVLALCTLVVGVAAALLVRLLPTVRLQLTALALLAVTLPLGAVLTSGWVMFHMHDDVKILAVSAASALSAVIGALLVARWVVQPLEVLRAASRQLATGELQARAPALAGPTELAELSASFNEMATSLEAIFDARRQLVAWASHDLRTPVAAIRAMLEAVEDCLATPEEYLPALREQVQTLTLLIDDLFELACIDAGALTLHLQRTKLADVVDASLRAVDAQARARRVKLEARIDQATPEIDAAPDKLERVLLNLLTNALRHTPSDGSVAVVVSRGIDDVRVAVEDTGKGVDPRSLERIFERFWKADDARARGDGEGAGLGLAIARGLVEAHGGAIWAEPRAGGGARVVFALPTRS
jgi:signal transduction histidine kinase